MEESSIRTCLYCKKDSIWSIHFKSYVCDECYNKNQDKKLNHG